MRKKIFSFITSLTMIFSLVLFLPSEITTNMVVFATYENTWSNTGDQRRDIVEIAKTQVGYHEGNLEGTTNGSNNYTKYNVDLYKIDGSYNYMWCQSFIAWCAKQANVSKDVIKRTAGTVDAMDFFKSNNCWENKYYTPQSGDIIYFTSSSSNSGYHVGIVESASGSTINTIEGNYSNKVARHSVSVGSSSIVGYGVPNYNNANPDMVIPTISTDKSSYIMGDTICASWVASPSGSNISHYWINVIAPDGTWIHEGNMNLETSYSFSASQEGEYTVRVYATPKGSKDGEGSLSDERKISVTSATWYGSLTPVNLGETFDSVLLAKDPWITIRALGAEDDYNVILQSEQGVTSEMWRFIRQNDGSYVITNFATGRVLDAYGLGTTDFTNVFTDVYNSGDNQKWFIYEKNGGYVLRPAYSDMVLDVDHAIFESGTNIEIHTQNDSTAQNFALYYENSSYGTPKTGNVTAEAKGNTITLNIDKGFYIEQQNIYRSKDNINWLLINTGTNEDNLTVVDNDLDENTTYYYKVVYINRYYNIESQIVSVITENNTIIGDCNNDGQFSVADILMLQKWLLNDETELTNWQSADLDENGMIDVFDLCLMKQELINK